MITNKTIIIMMKRKKNKDQIKLLFIFPVNYWQEKYNVDDVYTLGNDVHHYETGSGHVIDSLTYSTLVDPDKRAVSVYDYEESINESKRNIKLISKAFLPKVLAQFETSMNEIKSIRSES